MVFFVESVRSLQFPDQAEGSAILAILNDLLW